VKTKRPFPWPDPNQRFEQLRLLIRPLASGQLLWNRLVPKDRRQLGPDVVSAFTKHKGTAGMWMCLHACSYERAVIDVAWKIQLIDDGNYRSLMDAFPEAPSAVDVSDLDAAKQYDLVLIKERRVAYWKTKRIDIDWSKYRQQWVCLERLAVFVRTRRHLCPTDLSDSEDLSYLSKLISKMTGNENFPPSLADLIAPVGGGCYCLKLEPAQVFISDT